MPKEYSSLLPSVFTFIFEENFQSSEHWKHTYWATVMWLTTALYTEDPKTAPADCAKHNLHSFLPAGPKVRVCTGTWASLCFSFACFDSRTYLEGLIIISWYETVPLLALSDDFRERAVVFVPDSRSSCRHYVYQSPGGSPLGLCLCTFLLSLVLCPVLRFVFPIPICHPFPWISSYRFYFKFP